MESPISSSFIPSDTVNRSVPKRPYYGGGFSDLFVLAAVVLFLTSVALGIGVFLYQQYVTTSISGKTAALQRAKAAFEPSLITELTRLNDRMVSGEKVLGSHLAASVIFRLLEASTLQTVAFKSMTFEASSRDKITLKMQGVAKDVNSIALQADLFGKSGIVSSPIFSNITRDTDGVHFDMFAIINGSALKYVSALSGAAVPVAPASNSATPTTSVFGQPTP